MSAQAHEALVRRLFEEVWNQNSLAVANEIVHKEYSSIENQLLPRRQDQKLSQLRLNFTIRSTDRLQFQIERMFTEGDTIVTVWKADGVSKTETFVNRNGETVPRTLRAEGVSLSDIKDGKIAAHRFLWPRAPLFP